jgi:hypothetical protein
MEMSQASMPTVITFPASRYRARRSSGAGFSRSLLESVTRLADRGADRVRVRRNPRRGHDLRRDLERVARRIPRARRCCTRADNGDASRCANDSPRGPVDRGADNTNDTNNPSANDPFIRDSHNASDTFAPRPPRCGRRVARRRLQPQHRLR